jgi:hypothetical protein
MMARWCEIPSTKSQIPNKFKIANSNDQNGAAGKEISAASCQAGGESIWSIVAGRLVLIVNRGFC